MPLTKAEAALLTRRTGMAVEDFTWRNNGILTLLNDANTLSLIHI